MKVNFYVIERYISRLTNGAAASDPDSLDDVLTYEPEMDLMLRQAREDGNETLLRLAIDSLVASPDGRIDAFAGQVHAFSDDDLVDLLSHAFSYLWPDEMPSLPGEGPAMEFVPMSDEEWAARTGKA